MTPSFAVPDSMPCISLSRLAWQELDAEWRRTALEFQAKVHAVAVKLLKAIFLGLGRDASIIDEARSDGFSALAGLLRSHLAMCC